MPSIDFIRKIKDNPIELRGSQYLKNEDFRLADHQSRSVAMMLLVPRMILGLETGLGKSLTTLYAYALKKERKPDLKMVVVVPKSTLFQWGQEIERFTNLKYKIINAAKMPLKKRMKIYKEGDWDILILTGGILRGVSKKENDSGELQEEKEKDLDFFETFFKWNFPFFVIDEISCVNSRQTKIHKVVKLLSRFSSSFYGLDATIIKNRLEEAFNIYRIVTPELIPTVEFFHNAFCITKKVMINGKGRSGEPVKKPHTMVFGYKNIDKFAELIYPYFFGWKKRDVKDAILPEIITKSYMLDMVKEQEKLYMSFDKELKPIEDEQPQSETTKILTQLIRCQQISDCPAILGEEIKSSKEEELYRLLDNDLADEKVIIYTTFKTVIDYLEPKLKAKEYGVVRITGAESSEQREVNRIKFLEDSKTNIMLINLAGSRSLNLQCAGHMIFYTFPWSYGDYVQCVGRINRLYSNFPSNYLHFLVNKGTIDEYVLNKLQGKKDLAISVTGDDHIGLPDTTSEIVTSWKEFYNSYIQFKKNYIENIF